MSFAVSQRIELSPHVKPPLVTLRLAARKKHKTRSGSFLLNSEALQLWAQLITQTVIVQVVNDHPSESSNCKTRTAGLEALSISVSFSGEWIGLNASSFMKSWLHIPTLTSRSCEWIWEGSVGGIWRVKWSFNAASNIALRSLCVNIAA